MCRQLGSLCQKSPQVIKRLLFDDGLQVEFETGRLTEIEFHQAFVKALGVDVDFEALREAGCTIFELNEPIVPILLALGSSGHRLGLLSNTSISHAEYVFRTFPVLDAFDFKVMSFQVGAMKPDSRIYEAALALADCSPHECFFIDDMIENVEQARLSGMQSEVYSGAQLLIEQLEARGVSLDLVDDPKST
jgi:putative hydrolase of the HAD superfamily